jgi:hypothetical protein
MKTRQGPDFVFSPELFEAAGNVLGRRDSFTLAKAMRSVKTRARLRGEQYRILMQQKTPPARDEGGEPPPARLPPTQEAERSDRQIRDREIDDGIPF